MRLDYRSLCLLTRSCTMMVCAGLRGKIEEPNSHCLPWILWLVLERNFEYSGGEKSPHLEDHGRYMWNIRK